MSLPSQIGRYRILGLLGKGAMGTVYRGRDDALERDVAVKVMSVGVVDADARTRFQREAKAAARLQHPNIVTIYELGEHQGSPYMALELLEGIDLQRAIEAGIRPDPKVTLPIVLQVLAGLGHAHDNGIVHRDVKPSNVFLPRGRPAKIMDFGVARLAGGTTTAGSLVGTPNYMSPEQAIGGAIDGRSDLFSAGLILYELVTGEKAYQADSIVTLIFKIANEDPDLSLLPKGPQWERLRQVVFRSLVKKRDDRYPDARAMAAELALALEDLGGAADWTTPSDLGLMVRKPSASGFAGAPPAPAPATLEPTVPQPAPAAPASRWPLIIAGSLGALSLAVLGFALYVALRPGATPGPSASPVTASAPPVLEHFQGPTPAPSAPPILSPTPRLSAVSSASPSSTGSVAPASPSPAVEGSIPPGPAPADARLDRANDYMEKGKYHQALAEAHAILAREPNNAEAKALAGDAEAAIVVETSVKNAKAALKAGDHEAALEEIKKGLAVNPSEGRLLALFREATQ